MVRRKAFRRWGLPAILLSALGISSVLAQGRVGVGPWRPGPYANQGARAAQPPPVAGPTYRLAERPAPPQALAPVPIEPARPNEHPLVPAIRWARAGLKNIDTVQDYSATLVKRERINGKVGEHQFMFVKIRHKPFSVYMYFLRPESLRGREVIYIEGQNNGKMWAHGTGLEKKMFGTLSLDPKGLIAMRGQRYPITEIGIRHLIQELIKVGEADTKYGECEVKFSKGKVNNRPCTCMEVIHPVPRRNFLFHVARVFVDDELNVPIHYTAYDWPKKPGEEAEVIEEYTYLNMKLNNGFTDADFDIRNPNYGFN